MKKSKGITLIALVITIIVLLILAGVSLSLVTGSNGILGKASSAVDQTKIVSAKEQVELKIAEYQTEYYVAVYVNKDGTADVNTPKGKWIVENYGGEQKTEDYTFEITGDKAPYTITIKKDKTLKADIVGTLSEDGILSWGGFASKITSENYGEYVDLETSLIVNDNIPLEDGTTPKTDWRIFYKDSGGVYLILADYLPYWRESSLGTGLKNVGSLSLNYPYGWRSETSRKDLIDRLSNSSTWSKFLSSTYTSKGITVKGALDLEKWVASWNEKEYTKLYTNTYSNENDTAQSDGLDGYYVGTSENTTTWYGVLLNTEGYNNTLYLPHKSYLENNQGYWLSSPCAYGDNYVIGVYCYGCVGWDADLNNNDYKTYNMGVRPVAYLPSNILAEKNAEGVWEIK